MTLLLQMLGSLKEKLAFLLNLQQKIMPYTSKIANLTSLNRLLHSYSFLINHPFLPSHSKAPAPRTETKQTQAFLRIYSIYGGHSLFRAAIQQ
jgi:hypothetical protein